MVCGCLPSSGSSLTSIRQVLPELVASCPCWSVLRPEGGQQGLQTAMPMASFASLGPQHHSSQRPRTIFVPFALLQFQALPLWCCGSAGQSGGMGRRKKCVGGGLLYRKKRKKKSEKAVIWGLGMLVVLLLPLPDPPFQTRMRRLLRNSPGPSLSA